LESASGQPQPGAGSPQSLWFVFPCHVPFARGRKREEGKVGKSPQPRSGSGYNLLCINIITGRQKGKPSGGYGARGNWRLQGRGSWRIMKTARNKIFRVFMRQNRFVRFAGRGLKSWWQKDWVNTHGNLTLRKSIRQTRSACSSVGQSIGLLIRRSQVRILPGAPEITRG
jgi:hypothetical protein